MKPIEAREIVENLKRGQSSTSKSNRQIENNSKVVFSPKNNVTDGDQKEDPSTIATQGHGTSLSSLSIRMKSSSGLKRTVQIASRRLSVAFLAILRGYLDDERKLTSTLVEDQRLLSRYVIKLRDDLDLLVESQSMILKSEARLQNSEILALDTLNSRQPSLPNAPKTTSDDGKAKAARTPRRTATNNTPIKQGAPIKQLAEKKPLKKQQPGKKGS